MANFPDPSYVESHLLFVDTVASCVHCQQLLVLFGLCSDVTL